MKLYLYYLKSGSLSVKSIQIVISLFCFENFARIFLKKRFLEYPYIAKFEDLSEFKVSLYSKISIPTVA